MLYCVNFLSNVIAFIVRSISFVCASRTRFYIIMSRTRKDKVIRFRFS